MSQKEGLIIIIIIYFSNNMLHTLRQKGLITKNINKYKFKQQLLCFQELNPEKRKILELMMELSLSQFSRKIGLLILRLVRLMKDKKTSAQEPENDFFHCAPPHYAKTKERDHRAVWWNKQDCNISVSGKKIKCHI